MGLLQLLNSDQPWGLIMKWKLMVKCFSSCFRKRMYNINWWLKVWFIRRFLASSNLSAQPELLGCLGKESKRQGLWNPWGVLSSECLCLIGSFVVGWKDSSLVKRSYCSYRGTDNSAHISGSSQLSPATGNSITLASTHTCTHMHIRTHTYSYLQTITHTYTHIHRHNTHVLLYIAKSNS